MYLRDCCDTSATDGSSDGEAFPFESFHVEVHPGLANILSLDGHFFISEFLRKHHGLE